MRPPFATRPLHAESFLAATPPAATDAHASLDALRQSFFVPDARPSGSERRRLWQLPAKFHCPMIGVCFEVGELRPWVIKALGLPASSSDYELHVSAVSACASRTPLAQALHKRLEKRFQTPVRRFASATDSPTLRALWREAVEHGIDIPGALWATWTHPACDLPLEQEVFRDIHMIQHQVASANRADRNMLTHVRQENTALRNALDDARSTLACVRQMRSAEQNLQAQTIADLRSQIVALQAKHVELEADNRRLRQTHLDPRREAVLQRRLRDAHARISEYAARTARLEHALTRREPTPASAEPTAEANVAGVEDAVSALPHAALEGKRVLCVGGRTGLVDCYKEVVERRGGRFLHHDGGQEDKLQRIDAALSAADLVICQAGCISHNAYWRVKEQCKRTGKPCVFLKTPGTASFGRALDHAERTPCPDLARE